MCDTNLKQRYQAWSSQEINPMWLELKDRELQNKYNLWARNHVLKLTKVMIAAIFGITIF